MTLYEIEQEILNCVKLPSGDMVNTDTGEVIDVQAWENLKMERSKKIENTVLFIKNLEADAQAFKQEADEFYKRMKQAKTKAESLKKLIDASLCGNTFETNKCKVSYRKTTSVTLDDRFIEWAKKNADEYLKYSEPEANKTAIKKAIYSGVVFEFAKLSEHNKIQIK